MARRLARVIDEIVPEVDRRLGGAPSGRLHVILVDQTDVSNGVGDCRSLQPDRDRGRPAVRQQRHRQHRRLAAHGVRPRVHPRRSPREIARVDRRLAQGLWTTADSLSQPVRAGPGRSKGLATFEESAITHQGRVPAGDFRMLLDEASAAGRFAPLDRASSAVIDWPGGTSAYLYGAYFHQYLAERFGPETLARLSSRDGRTVAVPGLGRVQEHLRPVAGRTVARLREPDRASGSQGRPQNGERVRLTDHGFTVTSPAFSPDGRLFYSIANPHGFPALMERLPDGTSRKVADRFHGNRLAVSGWTARLRSARVRWTRVASLGSVCAPDRRG